MTERTFDIDLTVPDPSIESHDDERANAVHVHARGELDVHTVVHLEDELRSVIDHGAQLVIVDAREVSFIDSSGLRAIISASRDLEARGGRLLVENTSAAMSRVMEIAGVLERYRSA